MRKLTNHLPNFERRGHQMKRIVLSALLLGLVAMVGVIALKSDVSAKQPTQVVILGCHVSNLPAPPFTLFNKVLLSSSSAGAPLVALNTDCAQALADVLSEGFELAKVEPLFSTGTQYLLTK